MSAGRDGPPELARRLLDLLLPASDAGSLTGDLDEEYTRFVRPDGGRLRADLWYWRQVVLSAPGLLSARIGTNSGTSGIRGDWIQAWRVIRRRPATAAGIVATLGLGLGVAATVFPVVDAVLLQPLPYDHADRIVRPIPGELFFSDLREAQEIARRSTTLDAYAAWGRTLFLFTNGGEAEEVRGARVSWNHFDMLGARPRLGRTFVRDDAEADDAVILSHGLWVRRFGADRDVVGTSIDLFDREVVVVGVMGPEHAPMETDWQAWRTMPLDHTALPNSGLAGNGRLRDGVTLEEAVEEFRRVMPEIWAEGGYESTDEERAGLEMVPLEDWLVGDTRPGLGMLAVAVSLLLLLACANVANLLLGQSSARGKEFAVRSALGGSRSRIARQVVGEVGLLFVLGSGVALVSASVALPALLRLLPADLPRADQIGLDVRTVAFTLLLALGAALLTAMVPALRLGAAAPGGLTGEARGATADRNKTRLRAFFVAAEMAFAVVLVVGAGLMLRTMASLTAVETGFEASGVVTVRPSPPSGRYPVGVELEAYYTRVSDELAALPGVRSVGAIQFLPMTSGGWWTRFVPEGSAVGDGDDAPSTAMRVVREGYFETMRIPVLQGRPLAATDGEEGRQQSVVLNETLARMAFPGEDPVGKEINFGEGPSHRIVGVVGDVLQADLRTESHPEAYVVFGDTPWRRMHLVLRVEGDESAALAGAAAVLRRVDPEVSLLGPRRMSDIVGATLAEARLLTALLAVFGLAGLGLGAVGVYGVTAQAVAEQRKDIGIRIALGAEAGAVAGRTIVRGMVPVALGGGMGLAVALLGARLLEELVYGIETIDPGTFASAPLLLIAVALLALALPAVRASRIDPVRTLREE